jgi:hypothetical protein
MYCEIAIRQEFLHESSQSAGQFLDAITEETLFDSDSSDSDHEWDGDGQFIVPGAKISKHPMRPPIHDFTLNDMSEQAHLAFCELYDTPEFQSVSSFREQISVTVGYMRTDGLSILFNQIAGIFRVSKGTIIRHYQRSRSERKRVGRPTAVNNEIWTHVRYFITERFAATCHGTTEDVLEFISQAFVINFCPDTLRCKLRQESELRMITGYPLEQDMVNSDPQRIQAFFDCLKHYVEGLPSAFIFNLDESVFQDWADRRKGTVIVPATYHQSEIACPIDRATKRSSLLLCLAADGTYLKPLLILPRKTIEPEVLEQGISESMCKKVYQEHGFISTTLFEQWCCDAFFGKSGIDVKSLDMQAMLF